MNKKKYKKKSPRTPQIIYKEKFVNKLANHGLFFFLFVFSTVNIKQVFFINIADGLGPLVSANYATTTAPPHKKREKFIRISTNPNFAKTVPHVRRSVGPSHRRNAATVSKWK